MQIKFEYIRITTILLFFPDFKWKCKNFARNKTINKHPLLNVPICSFINEA